MKSNCYIIVDNIAKHCIVVDPASEKSLNEIAFINDNSLVLDYIILTHEHTDHTWGVNALLEAFTEAKILCSQACKDELPKADQAYFSLYMDDPNYEYHVKRVDITIEDLRWTLVWQNHTVRFIPTPGHSIASMCFSLDDCLFTGDTIMQFKKVYINKKTGSWNVWISSVEKIVTLFKGDTLIYPGHGATFLLKEYKQPK